MNNKKKTLIIIDANSIIHRAFHALPPLTTKKGELVNALYGFLLVLFRTIKEFHPDFVSACFDLPVPTFRHKKFKEYKAKRPPTPKELYSQIPKIKEVLAVLGVPIFEKEGFEADDIIGTISTKIPKEKKLKDLETIILTGDLDMLQLVNSQTQVYLLKSGVKNTLLYGKGLVKEKYSGLIPAQLVDYRALRGDPSDNIPGAVGIGEKTAITLLKEFSNIENLYKQLEKGGVEINSIKPKIREILLKQKNQVFLSKELAEIQNDVSITLHSKDLKWGKYNKEEVLAMLESLEFNTLVKSFMEIEQKKEDAERKLTLW